MKGSIVILNSGGLPMTVTDVYQDEKGICLYECTWISQDGHPHTIAVPAECVHLAAEDPIYQVQKKLQEENLNQQQRQLDQIKSQSLGLVKAMQKNKSHA